VTLNILLPKAHSEQRRWQQLALENEVTLTMVDPWLIETLPEQPQTKSIWLNLDQYQGVICVSPTAAKVLIDALDCYWPMPPVGVHWLCNGPRTASVLKAAGLNVRYPTEGNTAEDVLELPETKVTASDKWLIVKGEGGRVTYLETLKARGANAIELEVYRRSMNSSVMADMPALASQCQALWLSSEYLGSQLLQNNSDFWLAWVGQWWLSSDRLQIWATKQGITNTIVGLGATPEALGQMIKQHSTNL